MDLDVARNTRTTRNGRLYQMLMGIVAIPDHMFIGKTCSKEHGMDGKTMRFKKGNRCVQCSRQNYKRHAYKDYDVEVCKLDIDMKKAEILEAKMIREFDNYYEELL